MFYYSWGALQKLYGALAVTQRARDIQQAINQGRECIYVHEVFYFGLWTCLLFYVLSVFDSKTNRMLIEW